MRGKLAILFLAATTAAAVAFAFAPTASAHYCSSSTSCGPCIEGEEHAHSDMSGSCVSYEKDRNRHGGSAGARADWDGASAGAKFTPGSGALGALAALGGAAALAGIARRR